MYGKLQRCHIVSRYVMHDLLHGKSGVYLHLAASPAQHPAASEVRQLRTMHTPKGELQRLNAERVRALAGGKHAPVSR